MHFIGNGLPLRVKDDHAVWLGGQVFDRLMHRVTRAAAIGGCVPFGKAIAGIAERIAVCPCRIISKQIFFIVIEKTILIEIADGCTVGLIADSIGIYYP